MKPIRATTLFLFALLVPTQAPAGPLTERPCLRGIEPAASLLFPYFEVAPDSAEKITTLIAITNVLPQPILAKVVIWSDWALPVGSFNIYLTGFDVETLNLRDVLNGQIPATGASTSPVGSRSDPNMPFPGCDGEIVAGSFDAPFALAALRGDEIAGACWSSPDHPGRAVGYITIDVVNACSPLLPTDDGYFKPGGAGVASNTNALLGDFFLAEPGDNFAQGDAAVHLVADGAFFGPGDLTFYGRYVGLDGSDARIPLSGSRGMRFVANEAFDGGTQVLVWRDVEEPGSGPIADCNEPSRRGNVSWLRSLGNVVSFDEEENVARLGGPIAVTVFPQATQRVPVSRLSPWESGWLELGLGDQAWAGAVMQAFGRFSVGYSSASLTDPCTPGE